MNPNINVLQYLKMKFIKIFNGHTVEKIDNHFEKMIVNKFSQRKEKEKHVQGGEKTILFCDFISAVKLYCFG